MYERILVPVDGSAPSNRGLDEALKLAKRFGSRLCLMHVIDEPYYALGAQGFSGGGVDLLALTRQAGEAVLAEAKARVDKSGVQADTVLHDTFSGRLCDLVVQETRQWHADLIVLGTHGRRGAGRLLLGSDAEQILRLAPVPVLLVREAGLTT